MLSDYPELLQCSFRYVLVVEFVTYSVLKIVQGLEVTHRFSDILEYSSKGNIFQMTIRTLVGGMTFVCESPQVDSCLSIYFYTKSNCFFHNRPVLIYVVRKLYMNPFKRIELRDKPCPTFVPFQAYTMEDLIRSYVRMYEEEKQVTRSRYMFS